MKRVLSLLLAVVLICTMLPSISFHAHAAESPKYKKAVLSVDLSLIKKVGSQSSGSQACACFSLAYCTTILDNRVHYYSEYNLGSNQYNAIANWGAGNYMNAYAPTNIKDAYRRLYDEVVSGSPVVVKVSGKRSSHHYVAVVGVENVTSYDSLSAKNFLILDPAVSNFYIENMSSVGYDLKKETGVYQIVWNGTSKRVGFSSTESSGYQVALKANGGTCSTTSISVTPGNTIGSLPRPTFEGMTFTGWYTEPFGGNYVDQNMKPSGDMTIYAHYGYDNLVEFDPNGGYLPAPVLTETIDGVNIGRPGESLVVFNESGKEVNTNVYGVEIAVGRDGEILGVRDYGDENKLTVPDGGFVLSGQAGWDSSRGGQVGGCLFVWDILDLLEMNQAFVHLDYSTGEVKVYDSYNGYSSADRGLENGAIMGEMPYPVRDGYSFGGWYIGNTEYTQDDAVYSSMVLKAKWYANCNHEYYTYYTPETCETDGYIEYYCKYCDDYWYEVIPATRHYSVDYRVVPPTCEEDGFTDFQCIHCGRIETLHYPALGHNEIIDKAVAPTCTTAGKTEGKHCSVCGTVIVAQQTVAAKGHSWNAATCTTAKKCKTCGTTEGSALGHSWNAATCTTAKKCKTCGATEGSALGHSWNAATCTSAKKCKTCGVTEGSALGHSWNAATCTTAKKCKTCGATEGSALGHSWNAATCTTAKKCKTCGATEGSALGHSWNAATCTTAKKCKTCGATEGSALGHSWNAATCTTAKKCKTCGATEGSALGHSWNAATCTTAKKCKTCGATEGSALGHTEVIDKAVAATCTTAGKMEGKHCSTCNTVLVAQEEIPAIGHKEVIHKTIAPTCTETGLTQGISCSNCDEILVGQSVIPALGHVKQTLNGWDATCTNTGLTVGEKCAECGKILKEQELIPALGHKDEDLNNFCDSCGAQVCTEHIPEVIPGKAATCTEKGLTDGKKCSICGWILTYQSETSPLGHKDETIAGKTATCTEDGITEGVVCSVCGTVTVAQEVLTATGHTEVIDKAVAATCTKTGLAEGKHCSVCDEVIVAQQTIPAKGHTYSNAQDKSCDVCGYEREIAVPEHHHTYQTTLTAPTCTEQGYTTYTCACGNSYTGNSVAATGHNWRDATCTSAKTCKTCGATSGNALGHSWKAATCSTPKTCSVCGATSGYALGHDWAAGNCTTPKTCKLCGVKDGGVVHAYEHQYDYKCDACGQIRTVDMTRPMVDMFRMYDPNSGEHFYTGSMEERENLVAVGWNYEGVGFTFPLTTGKPVHRLYDPVYGEHLYTMDVEEMNELLAKGWNYEGIAFNSGFENEVPQYRLHNPNATRGAYHFTASLEERDMLMALGWEYQGIGWYSLGA